MSDSRGRGGGGATDAACFQDLLSQSRGHQSGKQKSLADHSHTCLRPPKCGDCICLSRILCTVNPTSKERGPGSWGILVLHTLAFSLPKWQENLERVKLDVLVTLLRRCSRKSLLQSKNLSTQSPGRPQVQKQSFCSHSAPSSPLLNTKNNFLLGVRVSKKRFNYSFCF